MFGDYVKPLVFSDKFNDKSALTEALKVSITGVIRKIPSAVLERKVQNWTIGWTISSVVTIKTFKKVNHNNFFSP